MIDLVADAQIKSFAVTARNSVIAAALEVFKSEIDIRDGGLGQ